MRTLLFVAFISIMGLLTSVSVWSDSIPTKGEWGTPGGLRSSIPAPPEASIEGNTLSIYFADALSGVALYIMDETGNIIYQEVLSSNNSDYTYDVPWTGTSGNYRLLMTHASYGYQGGLFTIQ